MSTVELNDTVVAQATAVGEGAIGIIRLSGPQSKAILSNIFRGPIVSQLIVSHRLYLGNIIHPETQEPIDQVMAVWMKSPNSFTGEEMVEIHAHGGAVILQRLLKLIVGLGARLAEPGEFSKRAFLNGKIDLSQAEAVADLIAAKSEWAAKNALSQLNGTLSETIRRLRSGIIEMMALIEAGFDFVEEDVQTFQKADTIARLTAINEEIELLLDSFQTGQLYKEGLRVALIGRPNVGKSSLLNALLNEERAIVHETPGTTRDIVQGERKIHGIIATFYDTAGIREAHHPVENEGIRRSTEILEKADLILLLLDSNRELTDDDKNLLQKMNSRRCIIIYNKIDLPPVWEPGRGADISIDHPIIKMSTKQREGIEELINTIYDICIKKELVKDHGYVLNNVRHKRVLEEIDGQLRELIQKLVHNSLSEECLAEELRIISDELGGITGEITNETVLDEVFSRFCIGK